MGYTGMCCRSARCIFYLAETGKGIKITSGRRVIVQTKPCERQARFGKGACAQERWTGQRLDKDQTAYAERFMNCDIPHCGNKQ